MRSDPVGPLWRLSRKDNGAAPYDRPSAQIGSPAAGTWRLALPGGYGSNADFARWLANNQRGWPYLLACRLSRHWR
jgi:hypothetical protein